MISRCRTCRYRASSSPALPSRFYPALAIALGLLASCAPMCAQLVRVPAIRTVAGNGSNGYLSTQDGGQATAAELYFEKSLAVDAAGNLYIADTNNNRIREVAAATGIITTVAGTGSAGYNPSQDGGQATLAELNHPYGVALDGFGNLYIADTSNNRVRKVILSSGIISTFAGTGSPGYNVSQDGGLATSAQLYFPTSVAADLAGDLFISDTNNNRIREVAATTGYISTFAGTGQAGYVAGQDGGQATLAQINSPHGIALDGSGNLYIADTNNHRVRMVNLDGEIGTVAGTGTPGYVASQDGGPAASAELNNPYGVAVDGAGIVYIADSGNNRVREVFPTTQTISTVAGNGTAGYVAAQDGSAATAAEVNVPEGVAVDIFGNLYIADYQNSRIRKVDTAAGSVFLPNTAVGTTSLTVNLLLQPTRNLAISSIAASTSVGGVAEFSVGTITGCTINRNVFLNNQDTCVIPITFQPGNPGQRNAALTAVTSQGSIAFGLTGMGQGPLAALSPGILSGVAGNGTFGYSGDGGQATSAEIYSAAGLVVDSAGNLYFADAGNSVIRQVTPAGIISTYAGNGQVGYVDGVHANAAEFLDPQGIALDSLGNLYIADSYNNRVRKVTAATGIVNTIAGTGAAGYAGSQDGGPATAAELDHPVGVAVDAAGNVYIADAGNARIRKIAAATGIITTVTQIRNSPVAVAVDSAGNLYIADPTGNVIRKWTAATGVLSIVAGNGDGGYIAGQNGGQATAANVSSPNGVAVDSAGDLYIADPEDGLVLEVSGTTGTINTVVSSIDPVDVTVDRAGNVYTEGNSAQVLRLAVNAAALSFATTQEGTISPDSPQTITVTNAGNAALSFPAPTSGLNPSLSSNDFLLGEGSNAPCPIEASGSAAGTLASGSTCSFTFYFDPQHTGPLTATSIISDSGPVTASNQTVSLSGSTIVGTATQTIAFPPPAVTSYPGTATLTAASSSGLPIAYTVTSGPATVSGSILTYTGAGTVVVMASQPGNSTYAAATPVSIAITVTQPESYVSWNPSTTKIYAGTTLTGVLDATDSIPATIAYTASLLPSGSPASVDAATVLSAGNYDLIALITPTSLSYAQVSDELLFQVQNMNVFVANQGGSMTSLYNNGTQQSSAIGGGGIGAAVDGAGYVWSITPSGNALSQFTDAGVLAGTYTGVGGMSGASALGIDGASTIWVTNSQTGTISAIYSNGAPALASPIGAAAGLSAPASINVDTAGSLWIANAGNNTVTEIIGVAAPVVTPVSTAVTYSTLATKP